MSNDYTTEEMKLSDFIRLGYLQEANRAFFHPLGLALAVSKDPALEDDGYLFIKQTDDPEGFIFDDLSDTNSLVKHGEIAALFEERSAIRGEALGYIIQPVGVKILTDV